MASIFVSLMNIDFNTIIKNTPCFSSLDENIVRLLAKNTTILERKKNHVLFLHGDIASKFYIVLNGWIKLYKETFDGDEAIINILTKKECFGEDVFSNQKYSYSCEPLTDTKLLCIPRICLQRIAEENFDFSMQIIKNLSQHLNYIGMQLEHLLVMNVKERIGCFLLQLCDKNHGNLSIELPYDKSLIAKRLGMKAETFSRALKKLEETGVSVQGNNVKISDIASLNSLCCKKCSGGAGDCLHSCH